MKSKAVRAACRRSGQPLPCGGGEPHRRARRGVPCQKAGRGLQAGALSLAGRDCAPRPDPVSAGPPQSEISEFMSG